MVRRHPPLLFHSQWGRHGSRLGEEGEPGTSMAAFIMMPVAAVVVAGANGPCKDVVAASGEAGAYWCPCKDYEGLRDPASQPAISLQLNPESPLQRKICLSAATPLVTATSCQPFLQLQTVTLPPCTLESLQQGCHLFLAPLQGGFQKKVATQHPFFSSSLLLLSGSLTFQPTTTTTRSTHTTIKQVIPVFFCFIIFMKFFLVNFFGFFQ